jgi:hypothetical protein
MQDAHSVRALEVWHNDKKIAGALTLWVVLNTKQLNILFDLEKSY